MKDSTYSTSQYTVQNLQNILNSRKKSSHDYKLVKENPFKKQEVISPFQKQQLKILQEKYLKEDSNKQFATNSISSKKSIEIDKSHLSKQVDKTEFKSYKDIIAAVKNTQPSSRPLLTSQEYFQLSNNLISKSMSIQKFRQKSEQFNIKPIKNELSTNLYQHKECLSKINQFAQGEITQKQFLNSMRTYNLNNPEILSVVKKEQLSPVKHSRITQTYLNQENEKLDQYRFLNGYISPTRNNKQVLNTYNRIFNPFNSLQQKQTQTENVFGSPSALKTPSPHSFLEKSAQSQLSPRGNYYPNQLHCNSDIITWKQLGYYSSLQKENEDKQLAGIKQKKEKTSSNVYKLQSPFLVDNVKFDNSDYKNLDMYGLNSYRTKERGLISPQNRNLHLSPESTFNQKSD